jgi:hypothetical protein
MPRKKKKVGKQMVDMTSDEEWGSSGETNWSFLFLKSIQVVTLFRSL